MTSNLPFSEWTQMIPNARLCKALIENIIDRAHTIKTGAESYPQNPRKTQGPNLGGEDHPRRRAAGGWEKGD